MIRKKIIISIIMIFHFSFLIGQNPIWTRGNAFTVPYKKVEINLMSPSKYGISRKSEISTHPLAFFVMPHLFFKHKWTKFLLANRTVMMSSRHGLYYPTGALNFTKKLNYDFLLNSDILVPYSIATQNEIILSTFINEPSQCSAGNNLISFKTGFKYALNFGNSSPPLIEQAILYRESAVADNAFIWYAGAKIDATLSPIFNYFANIDFYTLNLFKNISIEAKAGIMGYSGRNWSGMLGLKTAYSFIPSGNKFIILPIFDITYSFKLKKDKGKEMSLFGTEIFKHDNSLDIEGEENIYYRNEDRSKKKDLPPKKKKRKKEK